MAQANQTTTNTSTLTVRGVTVNLSLKTAGSYDVEVLTPAGQPSELSAYGLDRDGAAKVLVQLPGLLAECPEAASVPLADMKTMQALVRMGVPHARGAALAARPTRANKNQL